MNSLAKRLSPYLLMLMLGGALFPSSGRDDSHITYWAAWSLVEQGEILNYNGRRLEQSSSLLHTVLLAAAHRITGVAIPTLGLTLGVVFGLATVFLAGRVALQFERRLVTGVRLVTASSVPVVYWSFGGLETSLACCTALMVILGSLRFHRNPTPYSIVFLTAAVLLMQLTRPEAGLVLALHFALLGGMFMRSRRRVRPVLLLLAVNLGLFAAIGCARYLYFGAFFPQPVLAKVGDDVLFKLLSGAKYAVKTVVQYPMLAVLGALSLALLRSRLLWSSSRLMVLCAFAVAQCAFVLAAGGDWMEGGRFFAPAVVPLVLLALSELARRGVSRVTSLRVGLAGNFAALLLFAQSWSTGTPLYDVPKLTSIAARFGEFTFMEAANRVHQRDIPTVARLNDLVDRVTGHGRTITLTSRQAGMVAYHLLRRHLGKVEFVDLAGLSSAHLIKCPASFEGRARFGGIYLPVEHYIPLAGLLHRKCGMPMPDVVFDLDSVDFMRSRMLREHGYRVVYLQLGQVTYPGTLAGAPIAGRQFIAVKERLWREVGLGNGKVLVFNRNGWEEMGTGRIEPSLVASAPRPAPLKRLR